MLVAANEKVTVMKTDIGNSAGRGKSTAPPSAPALELGGSRTGSTTSSVRPAVAAAMMKTASNPHAAATATPIAGGNICATPVAIPNIPTPSPRRGSGDSSAIIDADAVGHVAMPTPCTSRSRNSEAMSCESVISSIEATMVRRPTRSTRLRRPRSLQRPAKGRSTSGTTLNPPTMTPICHFAPPISST